MHKLVLKKAVDNIVDGLIEVGKFRYVLRFYFRIKREYLSRIMRDMKEEGTIEFKNHRYIRVLINDKKINSF